MIILYLEYLYFNQLEILTNLTFTIHYKNIILVFIYVKYRSRYMRMVNLITNIDAMNTWIKIDKKTKTLVQRCDLGDVFINKMFN